MHRIHARTVLLTLIVLLSPPADLGKADALDKLSTEKLRAVHEAREQLARQRINLSRKGSLQEYRANLHVHSHWSHDSRGRIEDIVPAAKRAGTSIVLFTEHPAEHYDFFTDGHHGLRDGVLLIPGAEMQGFLAFPSMSLRGVTTSSPQEFSDLVRGRSGQLFVSHPEERMDWQIDGVTGMEIYNTHADFKDEKSMIAALKNPLKMFQLSRAVQQYPQEAFASLQNYPQDYLKRWDELCQLAKHTGVSANDAHQNVGLSIRWLQDDQGILEDALGEKLLDISLSALPDRETLQQGKQPGDVLFEFRLDRYEHSLKHVGTHLLLAELSEPAVRECLEAGRAFVAFDWIADSTGFDFCLNHGDSREEMGSQTAWKPGMSLDSIAPLPVHWRLMCNGQCLSEADGQEFHSSVERPGVYRIEAWLNVAGESMTWILSNPVYVSPADAVTD